MRLRCALSGHRTEDKYANFCPDCGEPVFRLVQMWVKPSDLKQLREAADRRGEGVVEMISKIVSREVL